MITKINAETIVVGGGLSGLVAAITLAREGHEVCLVGNRPVLGGNSSSEIRVWTRGAAGAGNIFGEEMGILGELKLYNEHLNPRGNPLLWDEVLLDKAISEKNLKLFLNTQVTDVKLNTENEIESVFAAELVSEKKFEFCAKHFIDATGDGFLGRSANVPFVVGKESKSTYGEEGADENEKRETQGNTILLFTKKSDEQVKFVPPSYVYDLDYIEKLLNNGGRIVSEASNGCDFWWVEFGGHMDTIEDAAKINLENKKLILGIFNYIKNSGKFDADYLDLEWVGNISGKRESRRFVTEYVLTANDITTEREFDDVGFYGGWYMDFHPAEGIYSSENFCTQIPVNLYEIPLSTLYNKKVKNLFFAGRIIGTSSLAFASSRVMNTCASSGQAAGALVSTLLSQNLSNNDISQSVVRSVQEKLKKWDAFLLHKDKDESGVRKGTVSCDMTLTQAFSKENGKIQGTKDVFLAISNRLAKHAKLEVIATQNTETVVEVYKNHLPQSKLLKNQIAKTTLSLKEGKNLVPLDFLESTKDAYLTVVFKQNDNLVFPTTSDGITGVILGQVDSTILEFPKLADIQFEIFGTQNLNDGYSRPYDNENVFASPVGAVVTFDFEKEEEVEGVELFFNCNLSVDLVSTRARQVSEHHAINLRDGVAQEMVKGFEIYGEVNGKEKLIFKENENFQRVARCHFAKIKTKKLKIKFTETYGWKHVEVFEIKIC